MRYQQQYIQEDNEANTLVQQVAYNRFSQIEEKKTGRRIQHDKLNQNRANDNNSVDKAIDSNLERMGSGDILSPSKFTKA